VCARGSNRALLGGPSTHPLGVTLMEPPQFRRPSRPPDLEARIAYRSTDESGRSGPVCSGYRPDHDFGLIGELHGALHEYPDQGWVYPGTEARALLWLFAPKLQSCRFHPGVRFTVQEGRKVVAYGEVVTVLNEELARDS